MYTGTFKPDESGVLVHFVTYFYVCVVSGCNSEGEMSDGNELGLIYGLGWIYYWMLVARAEWGAGVGGSVG